MNKILILFIILLLTACSTTKGVYWCGDHPCINKKEKEAYFKKTMIVEVRDIKKKSYKNNSEIEKLLKQAKLDEKNRIISEKELAKQAKLEEKRRIKEEKELAKQAKLEEKRRIKEEKELAKQVKLDEKRLSKERKKNINKNKKPKKIKIKEVSENKKFTNNSNKFEELVEEIIKRNSLKPFPDINDIED